MLVIFTLTLKQTEKPDIFRRNWINYNPQKLNALLQIVNWNFNFDEVLAYWNSVESKLIESVGALNPLEILKFKGQAEISPPKNIKVKINKRNLPIKFFYTNPNPSNICQEIKNLNKDLQSFFRKAKARELSQGIQNPFGM